LELSYLSRVSHSYGKQKGPIMKKTLIAIAFAFGGFGTLAACDSNDGPLEEAGEELDDAAEDAADEVEDATD
jgi:hypothetical protein